MKKIEAKSHLLAMSIWPKLKEFVNIIIVLQLNFLSKNTFKVGLKFRGIWLKKAKFLRKILILYFIWDIIYKTTQKDLS
jgi:hypothetical protein